MTSKQHDDYNAGFTAGLSEGVDLEGIAIKPSAEPGAVSIERANGKSGLFHIGQLREVVEKFFSEKF